MRIYARVVEGGALKTHSGQKPGVGSNPTGCNFFFGPLLFDLSGSLTNIVMQKNENKKQKVNLLCFQGIGLVSINGHCFWTRSGRA